MPFGRTIAHHKRAVIGLLVMLLTGTACNLGRAPNTLVPVPTALTIVPTPTRQLIFIATLRASPTNPPSTATATPFPSLTPTITETFTPSPTAPPVPVCKESTGQVVDETINSAVSQNADGSATVGYRVYLPPCYESSQRRYPYVFLFHGVDGDQTDWTDVLGVNQTLDQGIANHSLPPMILIMPSGGLMEYNNYFADGQSFESFIVNDLLPDVDKRFCTWGDAAGRAIGGISRGGFWSYEIGLRHAALFSAIGGHSAFFDPGNAPAAYNPLDLAQTVVFVPGTQPRLWLDAGPDDSVHPAIDNFAKTLAARNIDPGYTLYPTGGHTNDYWMSHMAEYLAFYGLHWPRQLNDLPLCHRIGGP